MIYPDVLKTAQNAGILTGDLEPAKPAAEIDKRLSLAQAFLTALSKVSFDLYTGCNSLFLP